MMQVEKLRWESHGRPLPFSFPECGWGMRKAVGVRGFHYHVISLTCIIGPYNYLTNIIYPMTISRDY